MSNTLRLLLLVLVLLFTGAAAASGQLWLHWRDRQRAEDGVPEGKRLALAHDEQQRVMLAFLGVATAAIVTAALFPASRRAAEAAGADFSRLRGDMRSMEHLARTTVAQGEELRQVRQSREQTEEDLHVQQMIVNRTLEEKIRLGRDLHDGLIQSLYATGLTLETARAVVAQDPAEGERLLATSVQTLNTAIREVRSYIAGLTEEELSRHSLPQAVQAVVTSIAAGHGAALDVRLDADAVALVAADLQPDLLQIIREAVSNALRHGRAGSVTVRLMHEDGKVALLVADNGRGFDPATAGGGGHGLRNLRARADRLGATLNLVSRPGEGARVSLTFRPRPPVV